MLRPARLRTRWCSTAFVITSSFQGLKPYLWKKILQGGTLFVNYSDDTVRTFNAAQLLKDRETMGKDTFFRVYGFDVDVEWLREAGGWA